MDVFKLAVKLSNNRLISSRLDILHILQISRQDPMHKIPALTFYASEQKWYLRSLLTAVLILVLLLEV